MTFADYLFKRRHFDRLIITLCVRWYVRYKLSYRDLVEMMAERGLSMAHTTIMRWVVKFVPVFDTTWKVSEFATEKALNFLGWHQHLQHFIAGFPFGKIPFAQLKPRSGVLPG